MNNSLNAIFRPSGDSVGTKDIKALMDKVTGPAVCQEAQKETGRSTERESSQFYPKEAQERRQASQKASVRVRKERKDKKKDIKFPVTPAQREELRRLAKDLRAEQNDPGKKYETISNTKLLKKALDHYAIFPERYPPLLYKDTRQYMHAEPMLADFRVIEELSLKWNLSLRKTVYRLIMNIIYRGEVDSDAYRAGR
ncbi:hypothetical protein [Paenibacillus gansuensis]|uniref:Uncharacterized protein n=1 Tax=Paenibacillus gansuensis TaxID=306542 RepID=A0ABW5PIH3_9BACL